MENNRLTPQEIGRELKEYFREQGISQQEIAERLGITQAAVSARITGTRAFGKNAASKWAAEFGVNRGFLIAGVGSVSGSPNPAINQTISGNTGVAINQAGSSNQTTSTSAPAPAAQPQADAPAPASEGFFTKLCQDLMQQIMERDRRICCLEEEIRILKQNG